MKRRTPATLIAALAVAAFTLVGATPAQALSTGYSYVVVRDSACGSSGLTHVKGIQIANITAGWSLAMDYGDNIVYPKVVLGRSNSLKMNLACYVGSRIVGYTVIQAAITPTRSNQTFWVG